ncbi:hypothetical protein AMTR_s00041p00088940 [Amborella trichopoda]|uniref:Disease resistance R13L4/SHOC-2-like LRR domain-containing protein n=1 Tax=Amborella trichopoda TaxID=13333 RepID=W1PYX7_AMBTC|nr:hypothetical protein AMTR_s00041p00088940 [Amborella trichopoda]
MDKCKLLTVPPKSKYLRILDLGGVKIEELPSEIGNLKLLRYFGLRNTSIKDLPKSVQNLCKLEVLDARGSNLKALPDISSTGELVQLKKLKIQLACSHDGNVLWASLKKLTHLQSLDIFPTATENHINFGSVTSPSALSAHPLTHLTSLTRLQREWQWGQRGDMERNRWVERGSLKERDKGQSVGEQRREKGKGELTSPWGAGEKKGGLRGVRGAGSGASRGSRRSRDSIGGWGEGGEVGKGWAERTGGAGSESLGRRGKDRDTVVYWIRERGVASREGREGSKVVRRRRGGESKKRGVERGEG